MPIYEYECRQENRRFEVHQKMSEDALTTCPVCGGAVKKLISSTAFQLKGGGWYKDGYASTPSNATSSAPAEKKVETKETKKETP